MKCGRCRGPAVIEVRRHNAGYCRDCFVRHCEEQVRRAIAHFSMFEPGERILVAVSGGKDSLGLWQLLRELGYDADGLYLGLGIGEYSNESGRYVRAFADDRGWKLHEVDLTSVYGFGVEDGSRAAKRAPCSACGLSKRHIFNQAAIDNGYPVLATGHNLDDEAAVLFGNVLRWETEFLGRQHPVLPAAPGFVRKVKPLIRLSERELAAYCVLTGIDYIVEECPMAVGNRHLGYKNALNEIEERSPGTKAAFVFGFLERGHDRFMAEVDEARDDLRACTECGSPTPGDICAFCRMRARAVGTPIAVRSTGINS